MKGMITLSIFNRWYFNRTLSIYTELKLNLNLEPSPPPPLENYSWCPWFNSQQLYQHRENAKFYIINFFHLWQLRVILKLRVNMLVTTIEFWVELFIRYNHSYKNNIEDYMLYILTSVWVLHTPNLERNLFFGGGCMFF